MTLATNTILIADDHPLFRQALKQSLSHGMKAIQWLEADSANAIEQQLQRHPHLDLILLDLQMPGSHGYSTLIHLRSHYPATPVVVISAHENSQTISKAAYYGAQGFLPKSAQPQQLINALTQVLDGELCFPDSLTDQNSAADHADIGHKLAELTPQQYRVLQMFAEGLLNKQIAYDLGVSEATIKAHATAIFKKLGVRNRTQAVIALSSLDIDSKPL